MKRYEFEDMLKLSKEDELKLSQFRMLSKKKMDTYYKIGWHMIFLTILSLLSSILYSYLFLTVSLFTIIIYIFANNRFKYHGLNYNISNLTNDELFNILKELENSDFDPSK